MILLAIYLIHFKFVGIKDMHNIFYLGLSGEHRCPLGYLFYDFEIKLFCFVFAMSDLAHHVEAIHGLC